MENISPVVKKILEKRGITEEDDIREFLSDRLQRTYDPFLLSDMREGVDLVLSAVDSDENICIYGDYDTDGITSISIHITSLRVSQKATASITKPSTR